MKREQRTFAAWFWFKCQSPPPQNMTLKEQIVDEREHRDHTAAAELSSLSRGLRMAEEQGTVIV